MFWNINAANEQASRDALKSSFSEKNWKFHKTIHVTEILSNKVVDCKKYSFIGKVVPYRVLSCKFWRIIGRAIL